MTCVIICGGRICDYGHVKKYCEGADLVISADSGARHCIALGVVPDIVVGDFDSIDSGDYSRLVAAGAGIFRYPAEKDMTDSELAVEIAMEKGCSRIILLGAVGSRLDHSMSNLFLLKKMLDANVDGLIADEKNEVRLVRGSIRLKREDGAFVTLLPFGGDATGVSTRGLYFQLVDDVLKVGSSRGVSNRFTDDEAYVEVKDGMLLVITAKD